MQVLDLHGIRHHQVYDLVEDFILLLPDPIAFKIVVGNSNQMMDLVRRVLNNYSLKYDYENFVNLGAIVVYQDI